LFYENALLLAASWILVQEYTSIQLKCLSSCNHRTTINAFCITFYLSACL